MRCLFRRAADRTPAGLLYKLLSFPFMPSHILICVTGVWRGGVAARAGDDDTGQALPTGWRHFCRAHLSDASSPLLGDRDAKDALPRACCAGAGARRACRARASYQITIMVSRCALSIGGDREPTNALATPGAHLLYLPNILLSPLCCLFSTMIRARLLPRATRGGHAAFARALRARARYRLPILSSL